MIKQPDIQSVFHPTFLGNRVLAKPVNTKKSSLSNVRQSTKQSNNSDAIVINIQLSGPQISKQLLKRFGWLVAASLWGLVFAFLLMR